MRKFTLTLAERVILQPAIANLPIGQGTVAAVYHAMNVLEQVDFSEREIELIPSVGRIQLDVLPEKPKEITLEDAEYEWLVGYIDSYDRWQPRKPFFTMREAVKGAEKVKAGEEAK